MHVHRQRRLGMGLTCLCIAAVLGTGIRLGCERLARFRPDLEEWGRLEEEAEQARGRQEAREHVVRALIAGEVTLAEALSRFRSQRAAPVPLDPGKERRSGAPTGEEHQYQLLLLHVEYYLRDHPERWPAVRDRLEAEWQSGRAVRTVRDPDVTRRSPNSRD
jgi:hypothetical protein